MTATAALVGRQAELQRLERALDAADAGRPWAVGVSGEPGIGKSRLLGELGARAAARGHRVVAGRGAELERDVPFALWVDVLEGPAAAPGALDGLAPEQLAELAVALPAIGVAPAAGAERHRVARAVRALLGRLAAERPVTVLLDDAHWADPASADVIALLLHRPPDGPVLLVAAARTARAPVLEAGLEAAARRGAAEVIEVGALAPEAADALLPPALGRTARARLYRESGGNPFYLEALARAEREAAAGGLRRRAATAVTAPHQARRSRHAPATAATAPRPATAATH